MIGQCGITMQEYKTAQVLEIGYLPAQNIGIMAMQLKPQRLVGIHLHLHYNRKQH